MTTDDDDMAARDPYDEAFADVWMALGQLAAFWANADSQGRFLLESLTQSQWTLTVARRMNFRGVDEACRDLLVERGVREDVADPCRCALAFAAEVGRDRGKYLHSSWGLSGEREALQAHWMGSKPGSGAHGQMQVAELQKVASRAHRVAGALGACSIMVDELFAGTLTAERRDQLVRSVDQHCQAPSTGTHP